MSAADRVEFIEAAKAAAWPDSKTCPTCEGTGTLPDEDRRMLHCLSGFGMDLPLEAAIEEIEQAERVEWMDHFLGHDLLVITAEGRRHAWQVPNPNK